MKQDKLTCLVTGASSGIGFAIASALHQDGHQIIATARRSDRLNQLGLPPENVLSGDLAEPAFQDAITEFAFGKHGGCDYLFNCAGMIEVGSIEDLDVDQMSAMMRLNVEATFRLSYLVLKRFKAQGRGHVVNISSILGTKVRPTAGAYAATKFAMEALSEALRMELTGTRIKVSCLQPGLVMTELHKDWDVHPRESMGIAEPLTVDNIVESVRFIMGQPEHVRIPKMLILPDDHNI